MSDPVGKRIFFIFSVIFLDVFRGRRFGTFFGRFSDHLGRTFDRIGALQTTFRRIFLDILRSKNFHRFGEGVWVTI